MEDSGESKVCKESTVQALVGMTSLGEQKFYSECIADLFEEDGAIVDLGCWMCSTAISLARGFAGKRNNRCGDVSKVYAFDYFIWEEWMNIFSSGIDGDYLPGDDFMPEARKRIGGYEHCIELIKADLSDYVWGGGSIKILLVDAMKSWELAQSIAVSFYPDLVEGGVLIHQDYKHFYTPWIHILQYRLREYFSFSHEVMDGSTVAFRVNRKIPVEIVKSAIQFDDISDVEVMDAMAYSMELVSAKWKSAIAAAHVMYFVHRGRKSFANKIMNEYSSSDLPLAHDFNQAKNHVETMAD